MAVELTPEEQAKFDLVLKERGYDEHASKVIERLNGESKSHRERAEKAESDAKALRDAEAARKFEEDKKKADQEAKRKKEEDDKKSVDERIKSLEETFKRELTAKEEALVKKQQEFLDELKARDGQILMEAVRRTAMKRGIIDEDLVSMLDVSKVSIEKGKPDQSAIDDLIEAHSKDKPHLYRDGSERDDRERDERGRFTRPEPKDKPNGKADASKLKDDEFEALERRLRSGRV